MQAAPPGGGIGRPLAADARKRSIQRLFLMGARQSDAAQARQSVVVLGDGDGGCVTQVVADRRRSMHRAIQRACVSYDAAQDQALIRHLCGLCVPDAVPVHMVVNIVFDDACHKVSHHRQKAEIYTAVAMLQHVLVRTQNLSGHPGLPDGPPRPPTQFWLAAPLAFFEQSKRGLDSRRADW